MTSPVFTIVFPVLLVVVMFGLGMGLTPADLTRVLAMPRAVLVTLLCQVVVLPALCFALVVGSGLRADLAVGMMVLAAAPGGPMASVFSHLVGGDVALNVTVTAINTVLAVVTLPVVVSASVRHLLGADAAVVMPPGEIVRIGVLVLAPVAVGMLVRRGYPALADRVAKPLRNITLVAVVLAICAAILPQLDGFLWGLAAVGLVALAFCASSLTLGYLVPRLAGIGHEQAVAAAFEIGIHNSVLAITVAVTVLHDPVAAVAPAMYGALMYKPLAVFCWVLRRQARAALPGAAAA